VDLTDASCPTDIYSDYVGAGHAEDMVATAGSTDDVLATKNTVNDLVLDHDLRSGTWNNTWTSDGYAGNPPALTPNLGHGFSQVILFTSWKTLQYSGDIMYPFCHHKCQFCLYRVRINIDFLRKSKYLMTFFVCNRIKYTVLII
jgi:hypothetical protein